MKTENVQILFYGICEKKLFKMFRKNCTIYCPGSTIVQSTHYCPGSTIVQSIVQ